MPLSGMKAPCVMFAEAALFRAAPVRKRYRGIPKSLPHGRGSVWTNAAGSQSITRHETARGFSRRRQAQQPIPHPAAYPAKACTRPKRQQTCR